MNFGELQERVLGPVRDKKPMHEPGGDGIVPYARPHRPEKKALQQVIININGNGVRFFFFKIKFQIKKNVCTSLYDTQRGGMKMAPVYLTTYVRTYVQRLRRWMY